MTPPSFKTKIREALRDDSLQSALDANAERRKNARLQGYTSLSEDINTMRQRAHVMRKNVIFNLDGYLEQFIDQAQKNGLIIHRAKNATAAIKIVLDIGMRNNARLIAKSKTMLGEEIRINEALESTGIEVVETDLGEFIVQLRQEPPAHIITPAVHLHRQDVGRIFQERLNLPYTEDVSIMTAEARKALRQVFLDADIGISGVNFGVAKNGALVLVTNEGNGRMVTTLPRVHIALMGIERIVPNLDGLALLLNLLPRSATGQKMTVYTSFIYGPRRPGDSDGPEERHLILLDNGRSEVAKSSLYESLLCIRCGACLNTCPIFREIGGHAYVNRFGEYSVYPGPIGSVLTPSLFGYENFGHFVRACSLCGACKDACPVITDFPQLILSLRAGNTVHGKAQPNAPAYLKLGMKLFKFIVTSPRIYASAQRTAGFLRHKLAPKATFINLPAFTRWGYSKDMPLPAERPFRDRFSSIQKKEIIRPEPQQSFTEVFHLEGEEVINDQITLPLDERFYQELENVGAKVVRSSTKDLADLVVSVLREKKINKIQTWDDSHLPGGLLQQMREMNIQIVQEPDPHIQAGLTGTIGGIVDSGTLLIPGGLGKPLTTSLLPEIHLAIVRERDLYQTLVEAIDVPGLHESSASVLITGPSRTADIEMTMSIGMHGPRELYVFLTHE
jgi:L-lactate dehydrogenase complex protein LldF